MSHESQIGVNTPPASIENTASIRSQLDIVQDNLELSGTFPTNVSFKFIYWTHGSIEDYAHIERLAQHCVGTDRVGIEVARSFQDEAATRKAFQITSDYVASKTSGNNNKSVEKKYFAQEGSTIINSIVVLARAMGELGIKKAPRFFPVDELVSETDETEESEWIDDFSERVRTNAGNFRRRENTTLNQLHRESKKLARDGRQHQIAVIYGAAHSLLSVGMQELGARVSRVFVDKPSDFPENRAERAVRFNLQYQENILKRADTAALTGLLIMSLGKKLKIEKFEKFGENPEMLSWPLQTLMLDVLADRPIVSDKNFINETMEEIDPYIWGDSEVPFSQKRSVKKSLRQLAELAVTHGQQKIG